jgi:hypothetical protein
VTGAADLRTGITALIGFAAAEEQMLCASTSPGERGNPRRWAALPLIAHNTEFRHQQVQRLQAIRLGNVPGEFAEVDHGSAELYAGYAALPADQVAADSFRVAGELISELSSVSADDLLDPSRNPWLRGRQLWLQIVVRGFWHPTGHLAAYYLDHAQPDRAVALAAHGVATAHYAGVPEQALGMASYNLACALARTGQLEQAADALTEAIRLNADVRVNAERDPDLSELRAWAGAVARPLA